MTKLVAVLLFFSQASFTWAQNADVLRGMGAAKDFLGARKAEQAAASLAKAGRAWRKSEVASQDRRYVEEAMNAALNEILRSEAKTETLFSMIGYLFGEKHQGGGFRLTKDHLKNLGSRFADECDADGSLWVDGSMKKFEKGWLKLRAPFARNVAAYAIVVWISGRQHQFDYNANTRSQEWIARGRKTTRKFRNQMRLGLLAVTGARNWRVNSLANYRDWNLGPLRQLLTDKTVPMRIRTATVLSIFGNFKQIQSQPELLELIVSMVDEVEIGDELDPGHYDRVIMHHQLAQQLAIRDTVPKSILDSIAAWEKRFREHSDPFDKRRFSNSEVANLLTIFVYAGEMDLAREYAARYFDPETQKGHAGIIFALVCLEDFEKAEALLPGQLESFQKHWTNARSESFFASLDRFYERIANPSMQLRLEMHALPYSTQTPQRQGYELLQRAAACIPLLGSLQELSPAEQMRTVGMFSFFPSLIPQVAEYVRTTAPEVSVLEQRQFDEGEPFFRSVKRYDYHAVRVAAAYSEGDLELAKKLIEEVEGLQGTRWRYEDDDYLDAIGQVTAAVFFREMQTKAPDEFGEIRDFWIWFAELAHNEYFLRRSLVTCARHAALIYGEPLTEAFWKGRGTLSADEEEDLLYPFSWKYTYRSDALMGLLASGSFEWSSIVVGEEYRKQVMLDHYSRPEFALDEISARGNICNSLDFRAFEYQWMREAAADPASPWFARSFFALYFAGAAGKNVKEQEMWLPRLKELIENLPDPTAGYDPEAIEIMTVVMNQMIAYYHVVYPAAGENPEAAKKWAAKEYVNHPHPEVKRMAELVAKKLKEQEKPKK